MIRFAALIAALPRDKTAFTAYDALPRDKAAALALLTGTRPKRLAPLATVLNWVAVATDTPDFLLDACQAVTGDRAETAALLMPPAQGDPPGLTECLQTLTDRASLLALCARLPPPARTALIRLAAGTFRTTLPAAAPLTNRPPHSLRAVMTLVQPNGPEITLALWDDGTAIPITRLPLTLPETPQIMAWVRAHTTDRFGPVRQVPPELVFELEYASATPNRRRKCGLDLHSPRLIRWIEDGTADQIHSLTSQLEP